MWKKEFLIWFASKELPWKVDPGLADIDTSCYTSPGTYFSLLLFTFAITIWKVQVIIFHFSLLPSTCTQSLYERSVSFSALGTPHSGEEKITEMAKSSDNFAPYVHFQDQPRSTASLLKGYLTPSQVCLQSSKFLNHLLITIDNFLHHANFTLGDLTVAAAKDSSSSATSQYKFSRYFRNRRQPQNTNM